VASEISCRQRGGGSGFSSGNRVICLTVVATRSQSNGRGSIASTYNVNQSTFERLLSGFSQT